MEYDRSIFKKNVALKKQQQLFTKISYYEVFSSTKALFLMLQVSKQCCQSQALTLLETCLRSPVKHLEVPSKYRLELKAKSEHSLHDTIMLIIGLIIGVAGVWCRALKLCLASPAD